MFQNRVAAQTVTYTTETVAATNVLQGTANQVFYILKLEVATSNVVFNRLRINTTGAYATTDLTGFSLYRNTSANVTGAILTANDNSPTGTGETLDFNFAGLNLAAGSTTYFLVRATVAAGGIAGNTFKIDGAASALNITYTTAPTITNNNQTDVAGTQTIFRPSYTLTTEPVPAANVLQGTDNHVFYIFKLAVSADAGVTVNRFRLNTTGTYAASDISGFGLLRNTTASATGATLIANDNSSAGNGETLDFGISSLNLAAGSTTFFIVRATVADAAIAGNTFKINGAANSIILTHVNTTPAVTNSQTDVAGTQTIFRPAYTLTTEPIPAANVLQGTDNHVFYIFKLVVSGDAGVTVNRFRLNTTGTYAASDISGFGLLRNTMASATGATLIANDNSSAGNGETLDFGISSLNLAAGSTTFFIVRTTVTAGAIAGNTFKINGAANSLIATAVNTTPAVTNSQTDVAGLQTIFGPAVTYSTEIVAASNVLQGTANHVFYILKVEVGPAAPLTLNRVRMNTTGTYAAGDITGFGLLRNTSASAMGATLIANDNSANGIGETLDFGTSSQVFAAGSTTYLIVRANIAAGATAGNTFKIDGSNNGLLITFVDTAPQETNNQTDVAGEQLIGSPSLTFSTEPLAAANVLQGTSNHVFYIMKIQNGDVPLTINRLRINTSGNYATFDISGFSLLINSSATATGATLIANDFLVTGTGETLDFGFSNRTLAINTAYYLLIRANISPSSAAGDNFKINGAASGTIFTYVDTTPAFTDNQSDVAGLQTIFGPLVTYSTEPIAASSVPQGTANHPFYILKVVMGADAGAVFSNLNVVTSGTYTSGNITSFSLYRNSSASVTGATLLANDNSSSGSGETVTFSMSNQTLAAGSTTYLIIRATLAASATVSNTFFVNGQTNPATLSFFGSSPSTTNNQSNVAGTQTIESGLPVHLVSFDVRAEGSVRRLDWKTSMEENNDYFEVERSVNGRTFSTIGRVDGSGTINHLYNYHFSDEAVFKAGTIVYYRLKQVDFDGEYEFSRIVSANVSGSLPEIIAFPNPFFQTVNIKYTPGELVDLEWYSADGKAVKSEKKILIPASGEIRIDAPEQLQKGTYLLNVISSSGSFSRKLIRNV